jgi:hypothetical protein
MKPYNCLETPGIKYPVKLFHISDNGHFIHSTAKTYSLAKVNLSLDKPWLLGGVDVYLHLFSIWAPDGMSGQIHALAVLALIKVPSLQFTMRLCGCQSRSGHLEGEPSPLSLPGVEPRSLGPASLSLVSTSTTL